MYLLDGKPLPVDTPFTINDVQYPANWLRLASAEEKAELGITEIEQQARPDDRYWWVTENPDGSFTKIPKDLDQLKATLVSQVKATAGSMIAASDWKVTRQVETGVPVDAPTLAFRAAVRQRSNELEATINACSSVSQLETIEYSWPVQE